MEMLFMLTVSFKGIKFTKIVVNLIFTFLMSSYEVVGPTFLGICWIRNLLELL